MAGTQVQLRLIQAHISLENGVKAEFERQTYFLTKIVFHHKSEHRIDGKAYDLEAQFHHRQEGDESVAPQMVISVLYELSEQCDPQLDQVNTLLPNLSTLVEK